MKISARNVLKGRVKGIERGPMNAEVTIEVAPDVDIVSAVTLEALERLDIEKDKEIWAAFNSADVMIGTPHGKKGD